MAILSRTHYAWALVAEAIWFVGGICIPIHETGSAFQNELILRDSGARMVFAKNADQQAVIRQAAAQGPEQTQVVTMGRPMVTSIRVATDGELLIEGIGVFAGYHNNPDAFAAASDAAKRTVAKDESIRKFALISEEFNAGSGHLTSTSKLTGQAILEAYPELLYGLYRG